MKYDKITTRSFKKLNGVEYISKGSIGRLFYYENTLYFETNYGVCSVVAPLGFIDNTFENLWDLFGTIPVNNIDEIKESFGIFEKGTDKMEIWYWFEETYNITLGKYLKKR